MTIMKIKKITMMKIKKMTIMKIKKMTMMKITVILSHKNVGGNDVQVSEEFGEKPSYFSKRILQS